MNGCKQSVIKVCINSSGENITETFRSSNVQYVHQRTQKTRVELSGVMAPAVVIVYFSRTFFLNLFNLFLFLCSLKHATVL